MKWLLKQRLEMKQSSCRQVERDLVLLDIVMSDGKSTVNRIEALKRILEEDPSANVVICNAVEQQVLIKEALRSGA